MQQAQNRTPDPEMGGLSPAAVAHLLYTEWNTPGAAVQLNSELPLSDIQQSVLFRQARTMLRAIHKAGGIKATSGGNLPRRFVDEMVDAMLEPGEVAHLRKWNKVLNEQDVRAVHMCRVVAETSHVLHLYRKKFMVPKKKAHLLQDEGAGQLYSQLFLHFYRRFNLAYDSVIGPELSALQDGIPYSLYRLGELAGEWWTLEHLVDELVLPGIRDVLQRELCARPHTYGDELDRAVRWRILRSLAEWGLLETREIVGEYNIKTIEAVRVTTLYRSFLRFEIDDSYTPGCAQPYEG